MQDTANLLSVESDVNQFIGQELFALDSDLSSAFRELKVESLLNRSKITKRSGRPAYLMVFDLCTIPFLMFSNIFIFELELSQYNVHSLRIRFFLFQ